MGARLGSCVRVTGDCQGAEVRHSKQSGFAAQLEDTAGSARQTPFEALRQELERGLAQDE